MYILVVRSENKRWNDIITDPKIKRYDSKVWNGFMFLHDRVMWRDLVNTVINLLVPQKAVDLTSSVTIMF